MSHDLHVHSVFSDGRSTPAENLAGAVRAGLSTVGMVDHVRADTGWVPAFAAAVGALAALTPVRVLVGVEAKIAGLDGTLDLPGGLVVGERPAGEPGSCRVDMVLAADHRFPTDSGLVLPAAVAAGVAAGTADRARLVAGLCAATARAAGPRVLIAHLFSVLPKAGLCEDDVADPVLGCLVEALAEAGSAVEVSERWRCPSARVISALAAGGVPVVCSTDSHRAETVGRYGYVPAALGEAGRSLGDCDADLARWTARW